MEQFRYIKNLELATIKNFFQNPYNQFIYKDNRYLSNIISKDYEQWQPNNPVFLTTQTGSGKTHFILHTLMAALYIKSQTSSTKTPSKILYISNRKILDLQLKKDACEFFSKYSNTNHEFAMFQKIYTNLGLSLKHDFSDIFDAYLYHNFTSDTNTLSNINEDDYYAVIFDEAHFFTSDTRFNKEAAEILPMLISKFKNCLRIYLSATMDTVLSTLLEAEMRGRREIDPTKYAMRRIYGQPIYSHYPLVPCLYTNPLNYDHFNINLVSISKKDLVSNIVTLTQKNDKGKWLIFVPNYKVGTALEKSLNSLVTSNAKEPNNITRNDKAIFINAKNKDSAKNEGLVDEITEKQTYSYKYLITTSVLDNGVTLKEGDIKHLFVYSYEKAQFIQMLGRIRPLKDQKINLYLPIVDADMIDKERKDQQVKLETDLKLHFEKYEKSELSLPYIMETFYINSYLDSINTLKQVSYKMNGNLERQSTLGNIILHAMLEYLTKNINKRYKACPYPYLIKNEYYNGCQYPVYVSYAKDYLIDLHQIKTMDLINLKKEDFLKLEKLLMYAVSLPILPLDANLTNFAIKFLQILLSLSNIVPTQEYLWIDPTKQAIDNINCSIDSMVYNNMIEYDYANFNTPPDVRRTTLNKKRITARLTAGDFILLEKIRKDASALNSIESNPIVKEKEIELLEQRIKQTLCSFNKNILSDPNLAMINEYLSWMQTIPKEPLPIINLYSTEDLIPKRELPRDSTLSFPKMHQTAPILTDRNISDVIPVIDNSTNSSSIHQNEPIDSNEQPPYNSDLEVTIFNAPIEKELTTLSTDSSVDSLSTASCGSKNDSISTSTLQRENIIAILKKVLEVKPNVPRSEYDFKKTGPILCEHLQVEKPISTSDSNVKPSVYYNLLNGRLKELGMQFTITSKQGRMKKNDPKFQELIKNNKENKSEDTLLKYQRLLCEDLKIGVKLPK